MKRINGAAPLQRPLLLLALGGAWLQGGIATGAGAGLRRRLGRQGALETTSLTNTVELATSTTTSGSPLSALLFGEEQLGHDLSHISQAITATQAELTDLQSSLGASKGKLEALNAAASTSDTLAREHTVTLGELRGSTRNATGKAMFNALAGRLQAVNGSVTAFGARLGEGPWNLNERIAAVNKTLYENITRLGIFRKELFGRLAGIEANLTAGPRRDLVHLAHLRTGNADLAEQRAQEVEESMALAGIG